MAGSYCLVILSSKLESVNTVNTEHWLTNTNSKDIRSKAVDERQRWEGVVGGRVGVIIMDCKSPNDQQLATGLFLSYLHVLSHWIVVSQSHHMLPALHFKCQPSSFQRYLWLPTCHTSKTNVLSVPLPVSCNHCAWQ